MSHPPAFIFARRASIILHNLPEIGWADALSSWIHTYLGYHTGQFTMIPERRLLRYISIDSFLPTLKLFVSSVPVGQFLEVIHAETCLVKNQGPIFPSHCSPVWGFSHGCTMACVCCRTRSWGPGYIVAFRRVKVPSVRSILYSTT